MKLLKFNLLLIVFLLGACSSNSYDIGKVASQINFEIVERNIDSDGASYSIKLINNSDEIIAQNTVYISYPIKTINGGSKTNQLKVETTGNKLDISPGEEVILSAYISSENFENNENLIVEDPEIQFDGYINKVQSENKVGIITSFSHEEGK